MQSAEITSVRDQIRQHISIGILRGEYPAGARLDETKVSRDLGVSRTPIREALIALESDGLVGFQPRRGHFIAGPAHELIRDSFQVLGALEALAITLTGDALQHKAPQLREINRRLAEAVTRKDQYDLDRNFHHLLTEDCPNRRVQELLATERYKAPFMDVHYQRGLLDLHGSVEQHEIIIKQIEAASLSEVTIALQEHWAVGTEVVIQWLEDQK